MCVVQLTTALVCDVCNGTVHPTELMYCTATVQGYAHTDHQNDYCLLKRLVAFRMHFNSCFLKQKLLQGRVLL